MIRALKLFRDDAGTTSIEYAAIASLISIVAIGMFETIGTTVTGFFASIPNF